MTRPRAIRYVVIPHPDDEVGALALLEGRPDLHHVFVLLTRGEATGLCGGRGLQADLGERVPLPQPFLPGDPERCAAQRLDSWHAFLDGLAALEPALGAAEPCGTADGLEVWTGERTSRVVADLGDGRVSVPGVLDVLHRTRRLRGTVLPDLPERDVVGAAYWNATVPGSVVYTHRDHRAVHEALWETDLGLPGGRWCRTAARDPDARPPSGVTARMSPRLFEALMAVGPDGRRLGLAQVVYGWLAYADPPGHWPVSETDAGATWSRRQTFWRRR